MLKDEEENDAFKIDIKDLTLYVNNYCNKRCRGCYVVPEKIDMEPEWVRWCVENFKIGKSIIVGGEPVLSPILLDVLHILKEKNVKVTLSTNSRWAQWVEGKKNKKKKEIDMEYRNIDGKIMDVNDVLKTLENVDSIQISINGNKKYDDSIRGKGSFDDSMKAIELLKNMKKDIFLRATYSMNNLDQIDYLLSLAEKLNVHVHFFPYKGYDAIPLDSSDQSWLFNKLIDYTDEDTNDDGFKKLALAAIPQYFCYMGESDYCPAGKERINILPDGTITPCEMNMPPDHFILGKFEKELNKDNGGEWLDKDLLLSRCKFFLENIKQVDMECITCKHHRVCRSGCQETVEYMKCPLKEHYNYDNYSQYHEYAKESTNRKIKSFINILNRRIGC